MAELRAGVALGSHQWHVVALEADGPRELLIGQRRLYPNRKELQQALRSRGLVLCHDNRVRSVAAGRAA